MGSEREILAEGLRKAAMAELEGHNFYMMAAATTQDEKGKEVFTRLASEEREHFQFLKTHYDSLMETGKLSETVKLASAGKFGDAWPIFSDEIKGRAAEAHFEMTALSVGIQLELDAMTFYKELADKTSSEEAKGFFSELSSWEQTHYQALLNQQDSLKKEYWAGAGFEPF